MSQEKKKFGLGIRLKPTDKPTYTDGDIAVSSVDNKIKVTTQKYDSYQAIVYNVGDVVRYDVDGLNYKVIQTTTGAEDPTDPLFFEVYERSVVTEDQTQTLTNKTIDTSSNGTNTLIADATDVIYDDTVNVDRTFGVNVQDALDAVKAQLEGQDQAIEITYDNAGSGLAAVNVQEAVDELNSDIEQVESDVNASNARIDQNEIDIATNQADIASNQADITTNQNNIAEIDQNVDDLITLSGVVENSADLGTFTGTTITDNSSVKGALQDLETKVEFTDSNKVDRVSPSTDNAIVRFNGVTGEQQDSGVTITDLDQIFGATRVSVGGASFNPTALTRSTGSFQIGAPEVFINDNVRLSGNIDYIQSTDNTSGSNVTLNTPTTHIVALTSNTLVSVDELTAINTSRSYKTILYNRTGNDIVINDKTGANTDNHIVTGTGNPLTLANEASITLFYNVTDNSWHVVGGSGSGGGGTENEDPQTINNNQAVEEDIVDLLLDGATYKGYKVTYNIYRNTSTDELSETGTLKFAYKPVAGVWNFSQDFAGDNSGVTFSVTAGGQVQYTSTNLGGTGYTGNIVFNIENRL